MDEWTDGDRLGVYDGPGFNLLVPQKTEKTKHTFKYFWCQTTY